MTLDEVKNFMRHISSYYKLGLEKWRIEEWYKTLKNYKKEDLYERFESHKNSTATEAPKLLLLIEGLEKIPESAKELICVCHFCGSQIATERCLTSIKQHEDRCRSIQYLKKIYRKYFNREIRDIEKLYEMDNQEFLLKHDEVLKELLKVPTLDENDQFCICKYLNLDSKESRNIAITRS